MIVIVCISLQIHSVSFLPFYSHSPCVSVCLSARRFVCHHSSHSHFDYYFSVFMLLLQFFHKCYIFYRNINMLREWKSSIWENSVTEFYKLFHIRAMKTPHNFVMCSTNCYFVNCCYIWDSGMLAATSNWPLLWFLLKVDRHAIVCLSVYVYVCGYAQNVEQKRQNGNQ